MLKKFCSLVVVLMVVSNSICAGVIFSGAGFFTAADPNAAFYNTIKKSQEFENHMFDDDNTSESSMNVIINNNTLLNQPITKPTPKKRDILIFLDLEAQFEKMIKAFKEASGEPTPNERKIKNENGEEYSHANDINNNEHKDGITEASYDRLFFGNGQKSYTGESYTGDTSGMLEEYGKRKTTKTDLKTKKIEHLKTKHVSLTVSKAIEAGYTKFESRKSTFNLKNKDLLFLKTCFEKTDLIKLINKFLDSNMRPNTIKRVSPDLTSLDSSTKRYAKEAWVRILKELKSSHPGHNPYLKPGIKEDNTSSFTLNTEQARLLITIWHYIQKMPSLVHTADDRKKKDEQTHTTAVKEIRLEIINNCLHTDDGIYTRFRTENIIFKIKNKDMRLLRTFFKKMGISKILINFRYEQSKVYNYTLKICLDSSSEDNEKEMRKAFRRILTILQKTYPDTHVDSKLSSDGHNPDEFVIGKEHAGLLLGIFSCPNSEK